MLVALLGTGGRGREHGLAQPRAPPPRCHLPHQPLTLLFKVHPLRPRLAAAAVHGGHLHETQR